jgi:hypothetical protein
MCFRLHAVFSPHHDVWWGRLVRTPAMVAKLVTWRCQRVAMRWRFWGPKILIKLKILRGMCTTRKHQQVICGNSLKPPVSPCQRLPWSQKASTPLTWNDGEFTDILSRNLPSKFLHDKQWPETLKNAAISCKEIKKNLNQLVYPATFHQPQGKCPTGNWVQPLVSRLDRFGW